jgi:type IV pilus assembly protein PilW
VTTPLRRSPNQGLSLIELMVGVALGLITVLIISQVFLASEGQKRTATSGNDAQVNGTLALYAIQRDAQMAGYGLTAQPAALGCTVKAKYGSAASPAQSTLTLAPAVIGFGNGATPDTLTLWQSNKITYAVPMKVTAAHTQTAGSFQVQGSYGAATGDLILAVPDTQSNTNWCTVLAIAGDASNVFTSTQVPHLASTGGWNATSSTLLPTAGYAANSHLINLGTGLPRTYAINASKAMQATDLLATTGLNSAMTVAPQIVQLKALYGKDTNSDGTIDAFDATTPTTNAGWLQVVALRVAVVAQSAQYESVNGVASTVTPAIGVEWTVDAITTGAVACSYNAALMCIRINVSGVGSDWQSYRYKVFDTIIPMRNMLWTH